MVISIHAPTWGATCRYLQPFRISAISIHAPTWGTTTTVVEHWRHEVFQSTHPRGVRRLRVRGPYSEVNFNPRTHVGCDTRWEPPRPRCIDFNPRTHVGCDALMPLLSPVLIYFNPRTHVGCDTACRFRSFLHPNFNPRTHVGCDSQRPQRTTRGTISIHAPTWGAT